ncbi:MAG: DUF58 domain-containing protein [Opitutaceae bacterium]|nr:DUF58 domain-containing protein [Opitutaceae bacterium]
MSLVPSRRLLWVVLAIALVAVAAGPWPHLAAVWIIALGALALLALADAAWSLARKQPPRAGAPPVVRFARDREGTVPVTFENPGGRARRVRFALALPAEFESPEPEMWVDLPADAGRARIAWRCTPRRRGRFGGVLACTEGGSTLGLWRTRTRAELPCELRVHPNLLAERKHLAALFLAQGRPGARVQRTLGRGREFEKLRDYQPGDGFDEVHWKATAKRGRPVTKVFQAERTQEIYVVVDASRLSARPVVHEGVAQTALERAVTSALVLLIAAERQGDKFGLIAHDDRVRVAVRAGSGAAHYAACREAVLALRPSEATPDMAEIVRHLRAMIRRRALIFFLTDLTDPVLAEDFIRHVRLLSRQHLVLVGQLRAPEVAPLFTGAEAGTDAEVYRRLAGHVRWAEARGLAQKLKPLGVTAVLLENEAMAGQLVDHYMQVKRRQAL